MTRCRSPRRRVITFRELAQANPGRHRQDLAASLANLGVRYSALGRLADALPVTEEAVTIDRELARANPDRYRPRLGASLIGLAASPAYRPHRMRCQNRRVRSRNSHSRADRLGTGL